MCLAELRMSQEASVAGADGQGRGGSEVRQAAGARAQGPGWATTRQGRFTE